MKTLSLISAITILGAAVLAGPVQADEPPTVTLTPEMQALVTDLLKLADPAHASDAHAQTVTPEMQALVAQLLKSLDLELPKETAAIDPSATTDAPTPPSAPTSAPTETHDSKASQGTTSLRTSSLTTGSLMPSASLGGRGTTGGTPRLSDADWRALFPKTLNSR